MDDNQVETLSIFCVDSVTVTDRLTFNSCLIQGVRMTYWQEEATNPDKMLNDIFDILFEEVLVNRKKNKKLSSEGENPLINNKTKP